MEKKYQIIISITNSTTNPEIIVALDTIPVISGKAIYKKQINTLENKNITKTGSINLYGWDIIRVPLCAIQDKKKIRKKEKKKRKKTKNCFFYYF